MFVERAPNALDPSFVLQDFVENGWDSWRNYRLKAAPALHKTGLIDPATGTKLTTPIWGYGVHEPSWPGPTIQVRRDGGVTRVQWKNRLGKQHLLPVDENLHWCYALHGYHDRTIERDGVPMITHLHGGKSDYQFDGNPEFFYSHRNKVVGPQWAGVDGGFTDTFEYDNDVAAGSLWYHDHALGITRLNVYAGLAGFYFVRDDIDTGGHDNPVGLPAFPYEMAYCIQDRMFTKTGELFFPSFPGEPFYDDFITGEGADLPEDLFPNGGPTALAEFFGDHIVVNGKLWPRKNVERRHYRLRLLNGCDSRFMVLQFVAVARGATDLDSASAPLPFWVVGSDQGLGTPRQVESLVFEPGGRYDVVIDFSQVPKGTRVIMKNAGGDAPFGGAFGDALDVDDLFPDRRTDRVMAFDVVKRTNTSIPDRFDPTAIGGYGGVRGIAKRRRVALFEGKDEFGRLQPLLGTVDDNLWGRGVATPFTWSHPTTENPAVGDTEIWEIYNFTADAHPVHLHQVNFEVLDRRDFEYEVTGMVDVVQHNGAVGKSPEVSNIRKLPRTQVGPEYYEAAPKDMVTALPGDPDGSPRTGQMVRVKAKFEKPGRYVWHCHILSHEDHEMMRVFHVGPLDR